MQNLPFAAPGRFYRGNLHTHSTRSDGMLSPDDVVVAYRGRGYDFIALTDHFIERYGFPLVDTRPLRTSGFTTLLGAELHAPQTEAGALWHILAAGLPLDFAPTSPDETGPQLAARARAAGAFVGIAHPAWYTLTLDDALTLDAAHAVEVYNETCALDNDRGESWHLYEMLLMRGRRLLAYAADDAHCTDARPDLAKAWVHVRATELSPEALLDALKAGRFYSSQGPRIEQIAVDSGEIRVACSPARAVFVSGPSSRVRAARGDGITSCALSVEPFAGSYCRVTVVDASGRRAWSNPIWL